MNIETEFHDWFAESPKEKINRIYEEMQRASSKEQIAFLYEEMQRVEN